MHEVFTPVKRNRKVDSDDVTVDCFYDLCEETDYKVCGRTVTCGKFKNRGDAVFVNLFMIMWTSLLIAVIGPLVRIIFCVQ